jgi:hypothetical protein
LGEGEVGKVLRVEGTLFLIHGKLSVQISRNRNQREDFLCSVELRPPGNIKGSGPRICSGQPILSYLMHLSKKTRMSLRG